MYTIIIIIDDAFILESGDEWATFCAIEHDRWTSYCIFIQGASAELLASVEHWRTCPGCHDCRGVAVTD